MQKSITDYLDFNSKKHSKKSIFIENSDVKISYEDFVNSSKSIATNILKEEKIYNEPIAVFIDKSIDCLKAMFGVLYSGNFYCVIDTNSPDNRIKIILDTLKPKYILVNDKCEEKFKSYGLDYSVLNISKFDSHRDTKLLKKVSEYRVDTDPAYVLFTSGSTGIPKGSLITHKSLIAYVSWFSNEFGIDNKTIFGSQTPFYFSMSVSDVYSTIVMGATLCLIPKINFSFPVNLIKYLNEYKINTIYWVPSALSIVVNLKTFDYIMPKYLEKVLFAGEVFTMPQLNMWRKYLPNIMFANLFGPTETTDICTFYKVNRKFKDNETLPIGFPCDNTDVMIITEDGKRAKDGEVGELYVRGSFVGSGYYNNPEKTSQAFVQNPLNNEYPEIVYKTGDLGKYNKYGEIEYLGRKDFQIKHMGYRIELGEIETNINSNEDIVVSACIYDKDSQQIVLFFESMNLSENDVAKFVNKKLVQYMQPNKIIKLAKMPYNANGKIDRVKLKELYNEGK